MEPVIAVLPPDVIDQIAAGEVIERPASVVKELVDNAIDAGARTITVETAAGGRGLVRVSDDGCGMSASSAVLALERHATSKLRAVDDLWALTSMGFRGEALPSIASVSRMTLTTRRAGDLAATRVVIEYGKLIAVTEAGAAVGTTVEVADLLGNLPARLKFLKGEATEASNITDFVARIALSHPQLHLRLRHNGRTALDVPPDRDGFARAQALLGARVTSRMVAVEGEEEGVRITAYLGAPELAQATARSVQLFVGKRPVRDRGLLHAIAMGYGELVPRGRYPLAVALIDVPAGAVDINVHPQKHEVRFADGAGVCAAVRHVVQRGVSSAPWRAEIGGPLQMTALTSIAAPALPLDGHAATPLSHRYAAQLREQSQQGSLALDRDASSASSSRAWVQAVREHTRVGREQERREAQQSAKAEAVEVARAFAGVVVRGEVAGGVAPEPVPATGFFGALRYLGQLDLTYLVCDGEGELVLVDQHSAHERLELERLRARATERDVTIQKLLFPMTIEATAAELELVERVREVLARVGYEVEAFGPTTLAVKAVPAGIRHGDPTQLLRELLAEWAEEGAPSDAERLERVLAEIACHSVVRAGDRLSPSEAEALLRGLDGLDNAAQGPHGRPVLLRLPLAEIARRFGR